MADENGNGNAKIPFGGLWKNEAKSGGMYLSGRFGLGVKLLVFPNKNKTAGDNKPDFHMVLVEEPRKENGGDAPKDGAKDEAFVDPFAS